MSDSILSLIGLSKKAGRAEIGEELVGSAARAKKARVILVASDAAASSVRRAYAFAQTGACLCLTVPATKDTLGSALGRTSCAMMAVTDIGFADAIVKKLAVLDPKQYQAASEKLSIKAQRAAARKREQAQHGKNLRQGKRRTPAAKSAEPEKTPTHDAPKHHAPMRSKAPTRDRFANSRPVKKGKGSTRKQK